MSGCGVVWFGLFGADWSAICFVRGVAVAKGPWTRHSGFGKRQNVRKLHCAAIANATLAPEEPAASLSFLHLNGPSSRYPSLQF